MNWTRAKGDYPDSPRLLLDGSAYYCERCQVKHSGVFIQRFGIAKRRYNLFEGPHMIGVYDSGDEAIEAYHNGKRYGGVPND